MLWNKQMDTELTAPLTLLDLLGPILGGVFTGALRALAAMAGRGSGRLDPEGAKLREQVEARVRTEEDVVTAALQMLDEMDQAAKK